uniref:Uncharacterized protein n=1 Tax=Tetraselmis chuii TaxID=63592 RepID=A0A7S1SKA1_9CHLO|mmetsp:Transcript_16513/g.29449  ORF Transcript_16513/g.29449 Transcript_16513/m.29449 type:complete len:312 (+) Transcript_16513:156-1091(+)|eukprot:CAMPEP_0177757684 /NCGR_PEP_ID=MMETSP0491_2-20121128/3773_1 /TAXON_ID=63592 /ORGANISM="Tetraselmis chuii, Strain PLY429" /LENGTH=311 /DNA_ID=CAMNT_0019273349 /DNA_START=91 /DNA_END=1026 /DNA_ORIENTATION=-
MLSSLVDDGELQTPPKTGFRPSNLLLNHQDGIYTAAVFDRRHGLVDWDLHLKRLDRSMHHLGAPESAEDYTTASPSKVALAVCRSTSTALRDFIKNNTERDWDRAMVTVVVTEREPSMIGVAPQYRVIVLAYPLPVQMPDQPAVAVGVHGRPRRNPSVKDASWARERQPIEQYKTSEMAEVLLSTETGEVTEGLVTNFFIVTVSAERESAVQTATVDYVLPGILRSRVLQACEALGIPVVYKSPDLKQSGEWTEAFITNCIRGIQPVHSVITDGLAAPSCIKLPSRDGTITRQLKGMLSQLQSFTPLHNLD